VKSARTTGTHWTGTSRARPDQKGRQDRREKKDLRDPKDRQGRRGKKDLRDPKDRQDRRVKKGLRDP
jgi:hypothetical protein